MRYTVSGGYAQWHPGESLAQLTARADTALYMAKLSGRNRMLAHVPAPAAASNTPAPTPPQTRPSEVSVDPTPQNMGASYPRLKGL